MCRNIKTLFNFDPPATEAEIHEAALQFVRKISGFIKPSAANENVFEHTVSEVAVVSKNFLISLVTTAKPRNRKIEAERARAIARKRFGNEKRV